jgi:hypothetical protein
MEVVGIFNGHLVYFTVIWNIFWTFGIFGGNWVIFSVLVCCTHKNLATPDANLVLKKKIRAKFTSKFCEALQACSASRNVPCRRILHGCYAMVASESDFASLASH